MIDLSIIIVNYNAKEFLKKCLDSIVSSIDDRISCEVIVVDNASSDASASEISNLKSQISNLKIILNKKNVGFSRANNQGVKVSKESKYVLFLNPDTVMKKGVLEHMIEFMDSHKDAGAATCKLVMLNGKIDDASHRGFPTPWNSFSHFSGLEKLFPESKFFAGYSLGFLDLDRTHKIDVLAGAFMIVRRIAGGQAHWWDEDYFFYGEDIDFCYMLDQLGWNIYYVPEVFVTHYKGVSGGIKSVSRKITTASDATKKRATRERFNAMRIFYNKHYKQKYSWIISFFVDKGIWLKEHL